jgi:hypothetical protein
MGHGCIRAQRLLAGLSAIPMGVAVDIRRRPIPAGLLSCRCTDDGVRLLRHATLALCLVPGPVREMRSVSAEEDQAGLRRNSHNDRAAKMAVIAFKPAVFKVKLEISLTIENRPVHLLRALACIDQQMHVVDPLYLMRSWRRVQIHEIKKRLSNSLRTLETRDSSVSNCFMTGVSSKLSK